MQKLDSSSSRLAHHCICHHSLVTGFRSVVVITSALHAEGRRFETGRKQMIIRFRWDFNLLASFLKILSHVRSKNILEDPGATSWDEAIKKYFFLAHQRDRIRPLLELVR